MQWGLLDERAGVVLHPGACAARRGRSARQTLPAPGTFDSLCMSLRRGDRPLHTHPEHVAIFLTDANIRVNDPGGGPQEAQVKAGQVVVVPATTHQPENLAGQPIEAILVEVKV